MTLTRSMKDVWLFGGLDTLASDHNGVQQMEGAQPDDVRAVAEYIQKRLGCGEVEDGSQLTEVEENGS